MSRSTNMPIQSPAVLIMAPASTYRQLGPLSQTHPRTHGTDHRLLCLGSCWQSLDSVTLFGQIQDLRERREKGMAKRNSHLVPLWAEPLFRKGNTALSSYIHRPRGASAWNVMQIIPCIRPLLARRVILTISARLTNRSTRTLQPLPASSPMHSDFSSPPIVRLAAPPVNSKR